MMFGGSRCAISAFGSVIDSLMKSASLPFSASSRFGPVVPFVPGRLEGVAAAAAGVGEDRLAARPESPSQPSAACPPTGPVGDTVSSPPQPARRSPTTTIRDARRTNREFTRRVEPESQRSARERAVRGDVPRRVVDEQRDGEGDEHCVDHGRAWPAQREPDEHGERRRDDHRRVPGGDEARRARFASGAPARRRGRPGRRRACG